MNLVKHKKESVAEQRAAERTNAQAQQNAANLDYLAIMLGVDIHPESEAQNGQATEA